MISRLMFKPHITCLSTDILIQNGKTLTTDTLINKSLTNGSEVYCIDTSECYLYDEENKTLIKTKVNSDIFIDGEITPESINIINNKVDNFIDDVNEIIEQSDINKIVELSDTIGDEDMGVTATTLKGAIAEHTKQLNENTQKIGWVTPNMFGAKGNGVADDTVSIQQAINYSIQNKIILKGEYGAIYGITQPLTISDFLSIDMSMCIIKAINSIDNLITVNLSPPDYNDYSTYTRKSLWKLALDGNNTTKIGINGEYIRNITIESLKIINCKTNFKLNRGYEVIVNDGYFVSDGKEDTNGLIINTGDCIFDKIIMLNCHVAITNLGSNYYSNIHCWKSKLFNGSVGVYNIGGACFLDNVYIDSYYISVKTNTSSQILMNKLFTYFNTTLYTDDYDVPIIFFANPDSSFSYSTLSNSFITGRDTTTKLSNLPIFTIKESNNSYEKLDYLISDARNCTTVSLGDGIIINTTDTGINLVYKSDTISIQLNLKCENGFVHNQKIGVVTPAFAPRKTVIIPCILSNNQWYSARDIEQGALLIDSFGGVYLYKNSNDTKTFLMFSGNYIGLPRN